MNGGFWHMGGYALYVWSSYGAVVLLLAIEVIQLIRRRSALIERLRRMREIESSK
ncbi:MAG: heme exporter protein CcmD [Leptospirillia bacterium]